MPYVVILAGPNGAGKSTLAPGLVRDLLGIKDFVNADTIARGLAAFDVESVALRAGRIMLERLQDLADRGADLAFETTLASRSFAPWIRGQRERGYHVHLAYVWSPTPALNVARVAGRVRAGGHDIPVDVIGRRYAGSLRNFFDLYLPLADSWAVYDNASGKTVRGVAEGAGTCAARVHSHSIWGEMQRTYRPVPTDERIEIPEPLSDMKRVEQVLTGEVRQALRRHKLLGESIAVSQDGKVVILSPEEIPDFPEEESPSR